MEPWTYKWSVGSLRRQRKHSLNHELRKWSVGRSNGALDVQQNDGRLRRQRKRSLNLELPKWSVGRPNEAWAPKWSVGRLRMERKRSLNVALPRQRFYQTLFGLVGFNTLRIKMFATARIS